MPVKCHRPPCFHLSDGLCITYCPAFSFAKRRLASSITLITSSLFRLSALGVFRCQAFQEVFKFAGEGFAGKRTSALVPAGKVRVDPLCKVTSVPVVVTRNHAPATPSAVVSPAITRRVEVARGPPGKYSSRWISSPPRLEDRAPVMEILVGIRRSGKAMRPHRDSQAPEDILHCAARPSASRSW